MKCPHCKLETNESNQYCQYCLTYFKTLPTEDDKVNGEAEKQPPYRDLLISSLKDTINSKTDDQGKTISYANQEHDTHPWLRYFARVIDQILIVTTIGLAIGYNFPQLYGKGWISIIFLFLLPILLFMATQAIITASFGTTIGKRIFNIRVTYANGNLISFGDAFMRELSLWIRTGALPILIIAIIWLITENLAISTTNWIAGIATIGVYSYFGNFYYKQTMRTNTTAWDKQVGSIVSHKPTNVLNWAGFAFIIITYGITIGVIRSNNQVQPYLIPAQTAQAQNPRPTPIVRVDDIPQTSGVPSQAIQKEADKLTQEFIDGTQGVDAVTKQRGLDASLEQMRQIHGKEVADIFYKQAYADTLRQSNTLPNSQFSQEQCTQKLKDFGYYLKISQECQFEKHKSDYDLKKLNQGCNKSKDEIETILKTLFNTINAKQTQQGKSAFCASEWEYYNKLDTQP